MPRPAWRAAKHEPVNTGILLAKIRNPNKTVISAKAGIFPVVIPAQAGIQWLK